MIPSKRSDDVHLLQQTRNYWAVYNNAGRSKWCTTQTCYPAVLDEAQILKLVYHTRCVVVADGLICPLAKVYVPHWAIVKPDAWDASKNVER